MPSSCPEERRHAASEGQVFLMKKIYLTVDDHLTEISTLEKGCWVHLQNPTREEIEGLNARFALDPTYLQAALDEEESARIERNDDQTLIIVDTPFMEKEGSALNNGDGAGGDTFGPPCLLLFSASPSRISRPRPI